MKISDIRKDLQKALDGYDWKTITNHSEFHKVVGELLSSRIPEGLRLTTWSITSGEYYDDVVFTYSREFVKDSRCRYADRGKFSNVKLEVRPNISNLTIQEVDEYFTELHKNERIKNLTERIANLKRELAESEAALTKEKSKKELVK